jgi:hypothetical protein
LCSFLLSFKAGEFIARLKSNSLALELKPIWKSLSSWHATHNYFDFAAVFPVTYGYGNIISTMEKQVKITENVIYTTSTSSFEERRMSQYC